MKTRLIIIALMLVGFSLTVRPQQPNNAPRRPKLVVGIIVDQMRWDYLHYYNYVFGDKGFNRLKSQGYNCNNCMLNYVPTVTAVGHAAVYTGSVPAINGIAGNSFYLNGRKTYCAYDSVAEPVGSSSTAGKMSPRNMLTTTMADAVKIAQNFRSKTVGVSLKDRAAILPAGHTADAAYWFDSKNGIFISSTYYMDKLPEWADAFNSANRKTKDIGSTPEGNDIVAKMAIAALEGEKLGQGATTDFLAVSFSATDYVGHTYGTRARQTEEIYEQLDRQLATLLDAIDRNVGKGNYLLFLTADHAAAHSALLMNENKVPAGIWAEKGVVERTNAHLRKSLGTDRNLVKDVIEYKVYLDHNAIAEAGLKASRVKKEVAAFLEQDPAVAFVVAFDKVGSATIPAPIKERIVNGYNHKRSGDMQVILQPGFYGSYNATATQGTTHGVWCPYDSHIPLIFYGWNISRGSLEKKVDAADIAATVCSLLSVQVPNGCIGKPIDMEQQGQTGGSHSAE